jgi:ribosomal protein S6
MPTKKENPTLAKYEAVFILDPLKVEGNGEAFSQTIEEQFKELGGEVTRTKFFEKRIFARPIGKHKAGLYWDYVVEMPEASVALLQDKYRLNPTVLRLAVFNFVEGHDDDVFKPRARDFRDDSFQDDGFERDSYRGSRDR